MTNDKQMIEDNAISDAFDELEKRTDLMHDEDSFEAGWKAHSEWQSQQSPGEAFDKWADQITERLHDLALDKPVDEAPGWGEIHDIITAHPPAPVANPEPWKDGWTDWWTGSDGWSHVKTDVLNRHIQAESPAPVAAVPEGWKAVPPEAPMEVMALAHRWPIEPHQLQRLYRDIVRAATPHPDERDSEADT